MMKWILAPSLLMAAFWLFSGWSVDPHSAPQQSVQQTYYVLSVLSLILAGITGLIYQVRQTGADIIEAMGKQPRRSKGVSFPPAAPAKQTIKAAPEVLVID